MFYVDVYDVVYCVGVGVGVVDDGAGVYGYDASVADDANVVDDACDGVGDVCNVYAGRIIMSNVCTMYGVVWVVVVCIVVCMSVICVAGCVDDVTDGVEVVGVVACFLCCVIVYIGSADGVIWCSYVYVCSITSWIVIGGVIGSDVVGVVYAYAVVILYGDVVAIVYVFVGDRVVGVVYVATSLFVIVGVECWLWRACELLWCICCWWCCWSCCCHLCHYC